MKIKLDHYDVYNGLRIKEDELHLHTKVKFYLDDLHDITEKILLQNYNPFNVDKKSNINKAIKLDGKGISKNQKDEFLDNDNKALKMHERLKYVLFPDEFDNEEDIKNEINLGVLIYN
jgi:hypothetical protein